MLEKKLKKLDRSGNIENNEAKSRTPLNLRYQKGKPDLTPPISSPTNQSNLQIKAMHKEQNLKKNIADQKFANKGSKTPIKNMPFANKKLNLNLLLTNGKISNIFSAH